MFIKIYFILVCYLTVSTNSTEPNSNFDPVVSDSDKKISTTIKSIDSKIPIQPSLGISATNNNTNILSTLTQKGLNTAKTNQFSLTSIRKEPLTISTTGETVKQSQISDHSKKSNSQNQEYSKKTNKKTTSVNPNKTENSESKHNKIIPKYNPENPSKTGIEDNRDPEGSKITKPHNNIHSVNSENPNKPENNPISGDNSETSRVTKLNIIHSKKPDSPNNSDTETLEDSRKTKHNKTTLRMSVITEKSQTEDQDNSIKAKPSRKAESTDSDNSEKSITNKKTEQSKLEKTNANGQEKFSENLMGNKQKNHVTKIINTKNRNFDDALSLKKIKSQDLDESNDNSSSHFMIFIFIGLLFTIVAYVAFQKRKKIMAYVIEGRRRTSRSRRVSGGKDTKVSYKPLETEDKEAGTTNYKYVY